MGLGGSEGHHLGLPILIRCKLSGRYSSQLGFVLGVLRMLKIFFLSKLLFHSKPICACAKGLEQRKVHIGLSDQVLSFARLGVSHWGRGAQMGLCSPRVLGAGGACLISQGCVGGGRNGQEAGVSSWASIQERP